MNRFLATESFSVFEALINFLLLSRVSERVCESVCECVCVSVCVSVLVSGIGSPIWHQPVPNRKIGFDGKLERSWNWILNRCQNI